MSDGALVALVRDILLGDDVFLGGVNKQSASQASLVEAVVAWSKCLGRPLHEVVAAIEPCVRQSLLMSLLPARAFERDFKGSIDNAIDEHLAALGVELGSAEKNVIRDICINAVRLRDMDRQMARRRSASLATIRGRPRLYELLRKRQNGRCGWCGVSLDSSNVIQTLDHAAPKHLGDDPAEGENWILACKSCNEGKADGLAWSAQPEAYDYFRRSQFLAPNSLSLRHRAAVLLRGRGCDKCGASPRARELVVYRRVPTGLAIPANCSARCLNCLDETAAGLVLDPEWAAGEGGRSLRRTGAAG